MIAKATLHSLKHGLASASKYKIDQAGFNSLMTDFALAVQCPSKRTYHLYHYPMTIELDDGLCQPRVTLHEVPHGEILVLGMREEFSVEANAKHTAAKAAGVASDAAMFDFLNSAIDRENERGQSRIDRPSLMKVLKDGVLHRFIPRT
ncbi:MAG: hypothetical protein JWR60_530 [Polaromonas sp.]|nr:hypothetical protein [Polaromonas sp.]